MPEKSRHKQLKRKDAHSTGQTEYTLPSGSRLDALSPTKIAVEIERSGPVGIRKSVGVLKEAVDTGVARKTRLRVPHQHLDLAYEEMRQQRLGGELTNLSGTYKTRVPKRRK
jgi:hypothetical protein